MDNRKRKNTSSKKTSKQNKKSSKKQSNIKNTNTRNKNQKNKSNYPKSSAPKQHQAKLNNNSRERYNERYNQNKKSSKKRKVRNRNLNILTKIFTFGVFIVIISYFSVSIFKSLNKKPINYETIEYGSIEKTMQVKGAIIRDEVVYKANRNGLLTFNIPENEKVRKGEVIATVKDSKAIEQTEQDLNAINEKILQIQEQRNELSLFYEDVKKMDSQIKKTLDLSIPDLSTYNIDKIYSIKDSVNKKITVRNQMLLSESNGSVEELSNQKADKEQKINQNVQTIISNDSGILSYYVDGFEDTYSLKNKDKLTKEQILGLSDKELQFKTSVVQGESAFKIVRDNNFYIACYIKANYISKWSKGDIRKIYINDNGELKPIEVTIESISDVDKDKYVLMRSNVNMIDFIDKRTITFELSKPKEGFKLKLSGVAEEELLKVPTSYIKDGNLLKKDAQGNTITVPVKISGEDETLEYQYVAITKGVIDIGDTIINPKDKKEIKLNDIFTQRGIYVVNSGIYTFKNINTEESVEDGQFIIIDPAKNTNIKLYDRYASDISAIKQEGNIKDEKTNK